MKFHLILPFCLIIVANISLFADKATKNNYTGSWTDGNSWVGGIAPGVSSLPNLNENYTIYGYINVGSFDNNLDLSFQANKDTWTITIFDTLIVYGNVSFANKSMNLNIQNGGLFIILGDLSMNNNIEISSNGSLIVRDNFSKTGSQGSYTGSGNVYAGSYSGNAGPLVPDNNQNNIGSDLQNDLPDVFDFLQENGSIPLPIELISFSVSPQNGSVLLSWATASELNNDYFTIERSRNGKNFETFARVEGSGTTHTRKDYSYSDHNPYLGLSYYRLRQTDYDGTNEVFPAARVMLTGQDQFSVYPNPLVGQSFQLKSADNLSNESFVLNIYNIQGKRIFSGEIVADVYGNIQSSVDLGFVPEKGTYIVEMLSRNNKLLQKIQVGL